MVGLVAGYDPPTRSNPSLATALTVLGPRVHGDRDVCRDPAHARAQRTLLMAK